MSAIEVNDLSVTYDDHLALWNVSFSVAAGSLCGVIGPNGAGKSTFLKTCIGSMQPSSGSIRFFGNTYAQYRHKIAYVPQKKQIDWLFPITVIEVVLMGRYGHMSFFKWANEKDRSAAEEVLDRVGLSSVRDKQISELSGGQQQRLFVARALLQDADIFLLDEPFAAIDMATEKVLSSILKQLQQSGKTILVVHHDLSAAHFYDHLLMLNKSIVAFGPTDLVFTPHNLEKTYGNQGVLFEEVAKLAKAKTDGA